MKTICFCNSNLPWGGGEKWHLEAAVALARRGRRVFLAAHPKGALYAEGMKVATAELHIVPLPISRLSFLNPFAGRRLRDFFRKIQAHAVIMNLPADLKTVGPAAKVAGVPHVVFRRGSALPVRDSALNRRLYGTVITRLIVNSESTRRQVYINNPHMIPEERVTVLPNGIDARAFDARLAGYAGPKPAYTTFFPDLAAYAEGGVGREGRAACDAANKGRARPCIIGNAGRLEKQKGQHLFLRIAKQLLEAGAESGTDFRFLIAGEGERRSELEESARKLGIADKVVFAGFLHDMSPFWLSIDCFLLTSLWEGFGFVLLEAMLAAKPVAAFQVSNIPELITNGKNGLLFPLPEEERDRSPEVHLPEARSLEYAGRGLIVGSEDGGTTSSMHAGERPHPAEATAAAVLSDTPARALLRLARDAREQERMGREGRAFAVAGFAQERCMDRLEALLR